MIPLNHILPSRIKNIFVSCNFYQKTNSSISFFSSSNKHQSDHLIGCHATLIKTFLISFLKALICFKSIRCLRYFSLSNHKSDMINSFRIIFIKVNIMEVYIINIHTKNTQFLASISPSLLFHHHL